MAALTFQRQASTGDFRGAVKTAIFTGIAVAQANAWDRAFGNVIQYHFPRTSDDSGVVPQVAFAQALATTVAGIFVIYAVSYCHSSSNRAG